MVNEFVNVHGSDVTVYGYLNGKREYVFTEMDKTIPLSGDAIEFCSLQTGGMCMVDRIICDDGSVYTINDETVIRYADREGYEQEFEDGEASIWDLVEEGRAFIEDVENKPRDEADKKVHLGRHVEWGNKVLLKSKNETGVEFNWEDNADMMEKHIQGQRSYVMFNKDYNTPTIVAEDQFISAFSDEYGFDDEDRQKLADMELGDKIQLSEQWFVVCSMVNQTALISDAQKKQIENIALFGKAGALEDAVSAVSRETSSPKLK